MGSGRGGAGKGLRVARAHHPPRVPRPRHTGQRETAVPSLSPPPATHPAVGGWPAGAQLLPAALRGPPPALVDADAPVTARAPALRRLAHLREQGGGGHRPHLRAAAPAPANLGTPQEERSARSSPGSSSASRGRGASASRPAPVVAFRSSSAPGRFSERGSAPGRGGARSGCHGPSHWGQEGAGGRDPPSQPARTSGEAGPGEGRSSSSPSKVKKKAAGTVRTHKELARGQWRRVVGAQGRRLERGQ